MSKKYMTDQEIRKIYNKMYPKKWGEMYFSEQQEAIEKDKKNKYTYILCKILDEHMKTLEQKQREYLNRIIEHAKKYDKIIKDIVKEYEDKLAEKDKEIKKLNITIAEIERQDEVFVVFLDAFEKQIRHEVCEEIRNYMTQDDCLTKEELIEGLESFTAKQIFRILDQIEKGENGKE